MTQEEQAALADGVTGHFWALFRQHVEQEWGAGGVMFNAAVQKAAEKSDADGMRYLQMVIFAQKEIQRLLQWPEEQASQARQQRPAAVPVLGTASRRGPGL